MKNKVYLFLLLCCLGNFAFANTDKHLPNEANPSLTELSETNTSNIEENFTPPCPSDNISGFIFIGQTGGSKYYCSDNSNYNYWEAKQKAEENGGYLAVICSSQENDFIRAGMSAVSNPADVAWVGLNDESSEGHFRWVNESTCGYKNWASGEPNDEHNTNTYHGGDNVVLERSSGKWKDRNGRAKYEFVMEIPCDDVPNNDCNPSRLAYWSLNACHAGSSYSEFTAHTDKPSGFSSVNASIISNSGNHSCTYGKSGEGLCARGRNSCSWANNSANAFKFNVTVNPESGKTAQLTRLEFYEDLPSDHDKRPSKYGVRVLKNGTEIFRRIDLATSVGWSLEKFDFTNEPGFEVSSQTVFSFELLGYCNVEEETIWEIDEVKVYGCAVANPCAGQGGDTDGDGICDNQDNCPLIANPNQADNDNDGIGNVCDPTPNGDPANISIADINVNENAGTAVAKVCIPQPSNQDVTVQYTTAPGSATNGVDFTPTSGTVTIPAGQTCAMIMVPITDDQINEPTEQFTIVLSNPQNGNIVDGTAVVTINDNDDPVGVSIGDVTVNENAGVATVQVSIPQPSNQDVIVQYTTVNGTAIDGADYSFVTGTVVIPAGQTTANILIPITDDSFDEPNEQFTVVLSNPQNANIADGTSVVTINDNDDPAQVSIDDVTVNEDAGTATVLVSIPQPSNQDVVVQYTTAPGTATNGADFTPTTGTVTIPAGQTSATIMVPITDDQINEPSEQFTIVLSNPQNANIADGTSVVTINDNDDPVGISIGDVTVNEDAGSATLQVCIQQASGQDVIVQYTTSNGTANNGTDYSFVTGTVVIPAGQTCTSVSIPITDDQTDEPTEQFTVVLSNPQNGNIADGTGVVTILDNDDSNISIGDVSVDENDGVATIPVSIPQPSSQDVVVQYTTSPGSAVNGSDFMPTSGTVTIPAGQTTANIFIPITDDQTNEPTEQFTVILSNPQNGNIADGTGVVTINDNDDPAGISIGDITVNEDVGAATVQVCIQQASSQNVIVQYATSNGTANNGTDYSFVSGTVVIPAGQTCTSISIPIIDDQTNEPTEQFNIILSNPQNGNIADGTGIVTILDDDNPAGISVGDVTVNENAGTASVPVTIPQPSGQDVVVQYTTTPGSAGNGTDFTPTSGTVVIPAGQTSATITVPITDDQTDEPDEQFTVILSNPQNANIADGTGVVTILDDDGGNLGGDCNSVVVTGGAGQVTISSIPSDAKIEISGPGTGYAQQVVCENNCGSTETVSGLSAGNYNVTVQTFNPYCYRLATVTVTEDGDQPMVSVGDVTVNENAGTASVPVTIPQPSGQDVVVQFTTTPGSAMNGSDFTPISGSVTIPAGQTTATITVPITDDQADEPTEQFNVVLSNPQNGMIADGTGVVTILDDDNPAGISIGDVTVNEDAGTASVPVTIPQPIGQDVVVQYTTTSGTAMNGSDFTPISGSVTIPAGQTSVTITVPITDDQADEPTEQLTVVLSNPQNANIADGTGVVTILDDDGNPGGDCNSVVVTGGAGQVTISSIPSDAKIEVSGPGTGYAQQVVCENNCGSTETVSGLSAGNYNVTVQTFNPYCYRLATVTVTEDGGQPMVSVGDVTVNENAGTASVPVTIPQPSGQDVVVQYTTTPGSAVNGSDFTPTSGSVTIPAGQTSANIFIPITDDQADEPTEQFTVVLSNPQNGMIADGTGVVTILDDDNPAGISVGDVTVNENAGTAVVPVSIPQPSNQDVVVQYTTTPGTAMNGSDFTPTNGSVTIPAGQTTANIFIPITNDQTDEPDEQFTVVLSNPQNGTIADGTSVVTIADDDGGNPGGDCNSVIVTGGAGQVTISSIPSDAKIEVSGPGTGYAQQLVCESNCSSTETVSGLSDGSYNVTVQTFNPYCYKLFTVTVGGSGGTPNVSVGDMTVNENTGTASVPVTIPQPSGQDVVVQYTTAPGSAGNGSDFTPTSGTVTIPAGQTTANIFVPITDDQADENDEQFTVILSNPQNANIADGTGVVTIIDNDGGNPGGDCNSVVVTGASGQVTISSIPSGAKIEVSGPGTGYGQQLVCESNCASTETVFLSAGSYNVTVQTFNPYCYKQYSVTVTSGGGGTPNVSAGDVSVNENAGTASVPVTIPQPSGQDVVVQYTTSPGSAGNGSDFTPTSGTVTIPAGQTSATIIVPITDDQVDENDEQFTVILSNPQNGNIVDGTSVVTIIDNDGGNQGGDCNSVVVTGGSGQVTISNIPSGAKVEISGPSTGFGQQLVCESNCGSTETVSGLSAGSYNVTIQTFNPYCYRLATVNVTDGGGFTICADRTASNTNYCIDQSTNYGGFLLLDRIGDANYINNNFYALEGGRFVEYTDGTASLTGTWVNIGRPSIKFAVDVHFSGRTSNDFGKGHNCLNTDVEINDFYYYTTTSGTLTGLDEMAGALIRVSRIAEAFQVGIGANITNSQKTFGASGWIITNIESQPSSGGQYFFTTGGSGENGDININLFGDANACLGAGSRTANLTFTAFEAQRQVALQWATNSTYRNDYYVIEKSTDGENFEALSKVNNEVFGLDMEAFTQLDLTPSLGDNYYRLKQVYFDGSFDYTNVELINFNIDLEALEVYPNPVGKELFINMKPFAGKQAHIMLMNQYGQLMQEVVLDNIEETPVRMEVGNIPNGIYWLTIQPGGGLRSVTKKLVVGKMY